MSLSIQSNSLFSFNRTLSNENIKHAIESSSKEEATDIGIWEKIKDWFCGSNTREALEKFYELTHNNDELNTNSMVKKIVAFYQLKEMASPIYQDKFEASITQNEDGIYTFSFSIKDIMRERLLIYGTSNDICDIKRKELTNNSELLDNNTVIHEGIDAALSKVKYDNERNKLEGITSANQGRVGLHLLSDKTKQEMAIDQSLLQRWITLQMKCFDYYAIQRSSLDSTDGIDITSVIGTKNEWVYHFAESIDDAKKHTQKILAKIFNDFADYLHKAKTDTNINKLYEESELLKKIDSHILENNKEYPLTSEYIKKLYSQIENQSH
ncbi:hypothetical protein QE197_19990 (plasmid) [Arsenophonus nasoniae]|uniref:Secreted effector protein sopD2 n=1 Tax=Arsenophonus nasoniae TaxID=638 RepID=A0ABY8NTX4_9GAMM|nr:hypothetical protein [Arsenophonus nasoniae]WGM07892.1 hypothetical protein QE258_21720 [Arsenophonus nasoniae]WGM12961.1 hypothetical protein QE197_19990 [Arsenophonus nasoniae]WGM17427.1 hypothetical protein QE193_20160 [Arsenophonus nasoniae]